VRINLYFSIAVG